MLGPAKSRRVGRSPGRCHRTGVAEAMRGQRLRGARYHTTYPKPVASARKAAARMRPGAATARSWTANRFASSTRSLPYGMAWSGQGPGAALRARRARVVERLQAFHMRPALTAWHAAAPLLALLSAGISTRRGSKAHAQRGWKAHPSGGAIGLAAVQPAASGRFRATAATKSVKCGGVSRERGRWRAAPQEGPPGPIGLSRAGSCADDERGTAT